MNAILQLLLSTQFILLAIGIAVGTYVVRVVVQFLWLDNPNLPGTRDSRTWRSLILPLLPIVLGVGFFFLSRTYSYAYPDGVNTEITRFVFCLAAGALSSVVFRVIKDLLLSNVVSNNQGYPGAPPTYVPVPTTNPYPPLPPPPGPMPLPVPPNSAPVPIPAPIPAPTPDPNCPPTSNPLTVTVINNGHGPDST